ncbi:nuclear transport factor 2 family protein [Rhizobium sp. CSW-27]|uniref:nuclear transport factor 2 family protein n=1 Tax=Rhizobium sp. CSW-27 TaxID=2839985 RepID=UPI001C02C08C|nr:nuclear transport factor 2 family protein [Rhizobium sp. CSW-27]MBT9368646.1 nuclear transport factor 2 family protein [Rhizobium sp. CSW-27]
MSTLARDFVEALRKLEQAGEVEAILSLFRDDATVSNPVLSREAGSDGPARFWRDYRASFKDVASEFRQTASQGNISFLEWESRGMIGGKPFSYGGVTVLEEKDGQIAALRSYFDPARIPSLQSAAGGTADDRAGESELDRAQEEMAEQRAQGGYS